MTSGQIVILVILLAYLLFNVLYGLWYSRRQKKSGLDSEVFFYLGGRNITGFVLAMTTMATYISVSSFISGPGAAGMTYGYAQVWIAAIQAPVTFLVLGVLGNKLAIISRRTGAVTIAGYLRARYKSDALVIVTSVLMVAFFIAQMVAQFTGGATLIQSVTGLSYSASLLLFALTVVVYTAFGGFSAVAITDAIQGIVMCTGTLLFIFFVVKAGGGLGAIDVALQTKLPGVYDNLWAKYAPGTLLSFWVLVGFGTIGLPQTAVRAMSFKNTRSLRSAIWIGAITSTFVIIGMHLAGVWAGAISGVGQLPSSDYLIPAVVQRIMPSWMAGIFLAAPMAAIMSTADSLLLLASAAIIRDLWKTYFAEKTPQRAEQYQRLFTKVSVIFTVALGIVTTLLALKPPAIIFFLNLFAMGGLECTFLWPLAGGLFWKGGNRLGALASAFGAAATYLYCHYFVRIAGIHPVVWGVLVGGILYFSVSYFTGRNKPLDEDIIRNCF